jgi:hypothetical protein
MANFQTKKFQFGEILEGLAMEDVGVFYCHFVYFVAILYILLPFGMLLPVLVCCSRKNLATLSFLFYFGDWADELSLDELLTFSSYLV